jgi:hypothetical protein
MSGMLDPETCVIQPFSQHTRIEEPKMVPLILGQAAKENAQAIEHVPKLGVLSIRKPPGFITRFTSLNNCSAATTCSMISSIIAPSKAASSNPGYPRFKSILWDANPSSLARATLLGLKSTKVTPYPDVRII